MYCLRGPSKHFEDSGPYSANRELDFLKGKLGQRSVQSPVFYSTSLLCCIFIISNLLAFTVTEIMTKLFFFFF